MYVNCVYHVDFCVVFGLNGTLCFNNYGFIFLSNSLPAKLISLQPEVLFPVFSLGLVCCT